MNKISTNPKFVQGLPTNKTINEKGQPQIIKVRLVGSSIFLNPPPEDRRCEICGKNELEPYAQSICDVYEQTDQKIQELRRNPLCISQSITPDHKLIKHFRPNEKCVSEAFWECKDCYSLSNRKAIDNKNKLLILTDKANQTRLSATSESRYSAVNPSETMNNFGKGGPHGKNATRR
jgi:hypothetical protein